VSIFEKRLFIEIELETKKKWVELTSTSVLMKNQRTGFFGANQG
jgi:hypothetical protein